MKVQDILVFIPSKDYQSSQAFYQALGFTKHDAGESLSIFELGSCTFFLQDFYSEEFAKNLMMQLIVDDINQVYDLISTIQGIDFSYKPIKQEHWGKVIYMWGPAGELWHITQLNGDAL